MLNTQDITTFLLSLGLVLCVFINATNLNSNQSYLIPQQPWLTVATTVVGSPVTLKPQFLGLNPWSASY